MCATVVFFFKYLLSHSISRGLRQALIFVCEVHFAVLYALQINLVSKSLVTQGSLSMEILSQLGESCILLVNLSGDLWLHIFSLGFLYSPFFFLVFVGLIDYDSTWDFVKIALLACFCAIHNHGSEMLLSFSAFVRKTPCRPIGFSILKSGLNKSVLLSFYSSRATRSSHASFSSGVNGNI